MPFTSIRKKILHATILGWHLPQMLGEDATLASSLKVTINAPSYTYACLETF